MEAVEAIEDLQPATSSSAQVAKDVFSGTMGGITQVLVGQPFDLVKVRLQSSDAYKGMVDAATRIAKEEGPLAFYKGTALPLVGIGACVSLQFGFLEAFKRLFRDQNLRAGMPGDLGLGQLYLAGAAAGVGNSVVSGPVEQIRIRLQTQVKPLPGEKALMPFYSGPIDALRQIRRTDGIRGWFHGQNATLLREFHGYGMYFLGYEWLVQRHLKRINGTRKDLSTGWAILYGAGAGYSMWLSSYPLDVIKSRIQADALPSDQMGNRKFYGVWDCTRKLWKAQGLKGFFRGLTPTLIRSPVVNGATFAAVETTMKFLN